MDSHERLGPNQSAKIEAAVVRGGDHVWKSIRNEPEKRIVWIFRRWILWATKGANKPKIEKGPFPQIRFTKKLSVKRPFSGAFYFELN